MRSVGHDHRAERAQDAVVVGARDLLERVVDVLGEGAHLRGARRRFQVGIEARFEGPGKPGRDRRIAGEHRFHVALAERDAGLQQVTADGAQDQRLAPVETGGEHEPVEAVAFGLAVMHGEERLLEAAPLQLPDRACGRPRA